MKSEKELLQSWKGNTNPIVSICCITYNHQDYIEEALKSFLMQETTFPFEIIIHDDASPDNTANIIREYEKLYPQIIKPIYQTENQKSKFKSGMNPRFNYPRAKGKYIALCEGDDYWVDPLKLQKQVDFLEENEEYGMIYTKSKVYIQVSKKFRKALIGEKPSPKGILFEKKIPTLTILFRTSTFYNYMEKFKQETVNWRMGDYPLCIYFYYNSKIYFLDEVTSVRRLLQESASNFKDGGKRMKFIKDSMEMVFFYGEIYLDKKEYKKLVNHKLIAYYDSSIIYDFKKTNLYYKEINAYKSVKSLTKFYVLVLEKLKLKYFLLFLHKYL